MSPRNLFLACAAAAAALFGPNSEPAAAAKASVAKSRDWSQVVTVTPAGGFAMGNPAAKVKLVEYGSLACPHCRNFEETGFKPLVQGYVRTGKVNFEFRNLLISGPDISVSLLTRCAGAAKFFPMSQFVYGTQEQWQDRIEGMSDADRAALDKMTTQQRVIRFAQLGAMTAMAARFGVSPARARQCLSDPKALQRLLDMTQAANDKGVNRTPTFLINGKATDAATWEELEPEIKAALGDARK